MRNTTEPTSFIQGETVQWRKEFCDYLPSGGYSVIYYLRGPEGGIDIGGAADGDAFVFTISAAQSATLAVGEYGYQAFAILNADKFLVSQGELRVKAGLATISTGEAFDNRTQAEKDLEAVRALLSGKASSDVQSYTIGNRELAKIPMADLLALEKNLSARVRRERQAERLKKGGSFFKPILVRMHDD